MNKSFEDTKITENIAKGVQPDQVEKLQQFYDHQDELKLDQLSTAIGKIAKSHKIPAK